ncbi:MAG TPA: response regulator [Candidatus Thiothrix moscowensis]|uniref:response regulator n=1 Tax=unclassified Thiothrix TaxID=2636184 RepID=UPI0025FCDA51|nr:MULTISPECIES: response regulator [unclassified Thiothrix]HRJ53016.1 response regulator [Candidatus Thiothrix moscowensis]HRJ92940.1 response regulator [Candidatus Thiothrix moscowensis]
MKETKPLHRRLQKQLKRNGFKADTLPNDMEKWQEFLHLIDLSYTGTSDAQYLLERSLEVSSQEMRKLYDDLKTETEQRIDALHRSEQKTRFMANMSHELRTPIHGILGSLEIVKGTTLDDRQKLFVDTAYASCEVMLDIINNILDFSKLKAGGIELEIIEFSPRELVESISGIMSTMAQEKNLEVQCYIPEEIPARIKGDPARLRQMLMNLIGNAIKFTERGEVYTGLELKEIRDDSAVLRFEVRDTGIGIPPAMQKSVFESFVQVDASINRRYGGTGLGLTIVKEFAEMMGGKIGLNSTTGQGSTFWFEIEFPVVESSHLSSQTKHLEGCRVLVVDDNETNRRILESYLHAWKAEAIIVSNGHDALHKMEESLLINKPFDILLLDWFMPQMDGIALAKTIRTDSRHDQTPIVMLTSYGISQEKQKQAGVQAAVTKPVRSITLRDVLTDTMRRHGSPRHNQTHTPVHHTPTPKPVKPLLPALLLAEDNPVNALIAITMLEKIKIQVDHVTTGKLALKAMRTRPYKLVLMDINMPEMDGYTATRYIRKWERENILKGRTPVIAMTANALKGDKEKCMSVGMDDYLPKPVKQDELLKLVRHWLEQQEALPAL